MPGTHCTWGCPSGRSTAPGEALGMLHPTQGADPGLHGGCGIHLALLWSGCSIPLLPVLQSSSPRKPPGQGQH